MSKVSNEINLKLETRTVKGGKPIKLTVRNIFYKGFWGKIKTRFYWFLKGELTFQEYLDSPVTYERVLPEDIEAFHGLNVEAELTRILNEELNKLPDISQVILSGIEIMERINKDLNIEIVGEMRRSIITEHNPIGQLGVATTFRMWGMEENLFLTCEICESMISPMGNLVAEETVMMVFREQMKELMKKFPKDD